MSPEAIGPLDKEVHKYMTMYAEKAKREKEKKGTISNFGYHCV